MAFLAGSKLTASSLNAAVPLGDSSTYAAATVSSSSATYIDSTVLSLAFVTPASGKIRIIISAALETTGGAAYMSYRISGAAGTVAASDDWALWADTAATNTLERTSTQTGLVPGAAGTITIQYKRDTTGNCVAKNRYIAWSPMPM